MEQIIQNGTVTRGWIGVEAQEITPELAESFGLPDNEGALIAGVVRGSPADSAGIRPGDVLLTVAGKVVKDPQVMLDLIAALKPDERAGFRLRRDKTSSNCRSRSASGRPCAPNRSKAMCQLLGMNCNVPTDICFSFTGFQAAAAPPMSIPTAGASPFSKGKGTRIFLDPSRPAPRRSPNWCASIRSVRRMSLPTSARRRKALSGWKTPTPSCANLWGATGSLPTTAICSISIPIWMAALCRSA
jgi:hypothetical protein